MKKVTLLNASGTAMSLSNIFQNQTTKFLLAIEVSENNNYLLLVSRFVSESSVAKNDKVEPAVITPKLTAIAITDSSKNISYLIIEEVD